MDDIFFVLSLDARYDRAWHFLGAKIFFGMTGRAPLLNRKLVGKKSFFKILLKTWDCSSGTYHLHIFPRSGFGAGIEHLNRLRASDIYHLCIFPRSGFGTGIEHLNRSRASVEKNVHLCRCMRRYGLAQQGHATAVNVCVLVW